ncbi:MAG: hypothetical protein FWG10_00045 [Eubacteriaceae bacterium]|nr:hypothetical protein [Eubacteriaceae bacterium]
MIFILFPETLQKNLKKALQNSELAIDQVRSVELEIKARHNTKNKGIKLAAFISIGVYALMAILYISNMRATKIALFSLLATGAVLFAILALAKFFYVDLLKRQFQKALKKGYPGYHITW